MTLNVREFDIRDHYWVVASTGDTWSSKTGVYVVADDPDYAAWKAAGPDITSKIASEAELIEVLKARGVALGSLAPPPRRELPKSTVMARVFTLGKQAAVKALFDANFELQSKWFSPDWPNVFVDDPDLLVALGAMGLTDDEIQIVLSV